GRFARAVVADNAKHLASFKPQIYIFQRGDRAKVLGDAAHFNGWGSRVHQDAFNESCLNIYVRGEVNNTWQATMQDCSLANQMGAGGPTTHAFDDDILSRHQAHRLPAAQQPPRPPEEAQGRSIAPPIESDRICYNRPNPFPTRTFEIAMPALAS